jgi:hypothetical protein
MATDITVNGITVTLDSTTTEDVAAALWDAGEVHNIAEYDAGAYASRMLTATAETALWADATHEEDTEGTGQYEREIADLRHGYAPDFEEALPEETRDALAEDVDSFLRTAWLYLAADGISPDDAGHNFHLTRNGHGAGFWDRGYAHGDQLTVLAQVFGWFGLEVSGHGEDIKVTGHHN